jgi:hypothetical protein
MTELRRLLPEVGPIDRGAKKWSARIIRCEPGGLSCAEVERGSYDHGEGRQQAD